MRKEYILVHGLEIPVYSLNTVIAGSGAAGLNAADCLYDMGQEDITILTEGMDFGTSKNAGSDKQTYYKLTLSGDVPDSIVDMAKTLVQGGCMHGDIALVEAALSTRCFFKLVDIGVPFPCSRYGEYVGYKTDHDPRQRATSAGPLTSRFMAQKLEERVKKKGITIFDGFQVIGILTSEDDVGEVHAAGLIALELCNLDSTNMGITLFNCTNIVYAVGGPAGIYAASVYPESQSGATGTALEAGAAGINMTEFQYGISSLKFRWNLSGTYQQVIPRYISTDANGKDEREFLKEYFPSMGSMMDAIFLKGYQWPFDPRKASNFGSSLIDILVYNETHIKGRRVFLDFQHNPGWDNGKNELDFSCLDTEAFTYLKNSGALFGRPIDRLARMNHPAIHIYRCHGIDLYRDYLEIAVCAQHCNGGLVGNIWWESNVRHFFPVGEVNGSFGVYRPGGSALNSTQVGALRAAQFITAHYREAPPGIDIFMEKALPKTEAVLAMAKSFLKTRGKVSNVFELRKKAQARMTAAGAHIRSMEEIEAAVLGCLSDLGDLAEEMELASIYELPEAFKNRDILLSQFTFLNSMKEYIRQGGKSRGSYLIMDRMGSLPAEGLPDLFRYSLDNGGLLDSVCEVRLRCSETEMQCKFDWKPVRPIPEEDSWFENVWNAYRSGESSK